MKRVAINGFGRIGRMVLKAGLGKVEFVAINDLASLDNLAYLLKYDSAYGVYDKAVEVDGNHLVVDGQRIRVYNEKDPANLPWEDVDVVAECTGVFRTKDKAQQHIDAGADKVLISAPAKGDQAVKHIVKGVNEDTYNGESIVSNGSCTTNCLAPMVKVLHDNFGIRRGFLTTVHSYTASQGLIDRPSKKWRRGRAAAENIVPTTTGAASAIGVVLPALDGKLDGMAVRVPIVVGSLCDVTLELEEDVTVEQVNELFKNVSQHHLKGVVEYTEEELVSKDIVGNPHSVIFDSKLTKVDGNMVKVFGWYDNEWGFSNRMVDVMQLL